MTVLTKAPESQFAYVVLAARRARQIMAGAPPLVENPRTLKATRIACEELETRPARIRFHRAGLHRRQTRTATSGASSRRERSHANHLGVTGGVAAYKAAELVRRLQQDGFTRASRHDSRRARIHHAAHLRRAQRAESHHRSVRRILTAKPISKAPSNTSPSRSAPILLLVAPATADILAKFARGIADDFLTTLYLASTAPVVVAPAMNVNMWNHRGDAGKYRHAARARCARRRSR